MAQPRAVRPQGSSTCRRNTHRHALRLHVRRGPCSRSQSAFYWFARWSEDSTAAETYGLAAGAALILVFPYVRTQEGLAAVLIVLALIVSRLALNEERVKTHMTLPNLSSRPWLLRPRASDVLRRVYLRPGRRQRGLFLATQIISKNWILDGSRRPIHTDFTNVYAAGRLCAEGRPQQASDWNLHYAAENAAYRHPQAAYLGWHYPAAVSDGRRIPGDTALAVRLLRLDWRDAAALSGGSARHRRRSDGLADRRRGSVPDAEYHLGADGLFAASLVGSTLVLLESQPLLRLLLGREL